MMQLSNENKISSKGNHTRVASQFEHRSKERNLACLDSQADPLL